VRLATNSLKEEDKEEVSEFVTKCLNLLENLVDLKVETVANKLMHADNCIDFLILRQEASAKKESSTLSLAVKV
jgi:hypothetical protein